ncbi:MAG TPA: hypothetical protein VGD78_11710 [Chthoniobacterales bacterium]
MKASGRRKCLHCGEFYRPDRRNLRHQQYCAKPDCRKRSKAESQRRWLKQPQNQQYFCGPENSQRVKDWRQRHPGYGRKKKAVSPEPLQEVCRPQSLGPQGLTADRGFDALQDLSPLQPAVVVGLISLMTGSTLQEDIALTTRMLLRKGQDIMAMRPSSNPHPLP